MVPVEIEVVFMERKILIFLFCEELILAYSSWSEISHQIVNLKDEEQWKSFQIRRFYLFILFLTCKIFLVLADCNDECYIRGGTIIAIIELEKTIFL